MKGPFPHGFLPPNPPDPRIRGSIREGFPGVCLIGKLPDSGPPANPRVFGGCFGRSHPDPSRGLLTASNSRLSECNGGRNGSGSREDPLDGP